MVKEAQEGKFLKISCPRCRNRKTVFGKSTTFVKCEKCGYLLIKPRGGKAKVRAPVKEVLNG